MSIRDLSLVMANLEEIAERVERLSPPLQEVAFSALVDALLRPEMAPPTDGSLAMDPPETADTAVFDEEAEMRRYFQQYGLAHISDMEFATFVAYFHSQILPAEKQVSAVSSSHLENACSVTGRKLPSSVGGTLNNALNLKGFLERRGTGLYALTRDGSNYIKFTLMGSRN